MSDDQRLRLVTDNDLTAKIHRVELSERDAIIDRLRLEVTHLKSTIQRAEQARERADAARKAVEEAQRAKLRSRVAKCRARQRQATAPVTLPAENTAEISQETEAAVTLHGAAVTLQAAGGNVTSLEIGGNQPEIVSQDRIINDPTSIRCDSFARVDSDLTVTDSYYKVKYSYLLPYLESVPIKESIADSPRAHASAHARAYAGEAIVTNIAPAIVASQQAAMLDSGATPPSPPPPPRPDEQRLYRDLKLSDKAHLWVRYTDGQLSPDENGNATACFGKNGLPQNRYPFQATCQRICRAAGIADPHWRGDWLTVTNWLRSGASPARTILPAIQTVMERKPPGFRPMRLRYFDGAVADQLASNLKNAGQA